MDANEVSYSYCPNCFGNNGILEVKSGIKNLSVGATVYRMKAWKIGGCFYTDKYSEPAFAHIQRKALLKCGFYTLETFFSIYLCNIC